MIIKDTNSKGFTLVELTVSMMIITIAFLSFSQILVFSLKELKRSEIRFWTERVINNEMNRLLSKKFNSPNLSMGSREKKVRDVTLSIKVTSAGPLIKKIRITADFKGYRLKRVFYRSLLIRR